jgi:hypothetical protein
VDRAEVDARHEPTADAEARHDRHQRRHEEAEA